MNRFDETWIAAIRRVERQLEGSTLEPERVQTIGTLLRATNFPGALSLAALGEHRGSGEPMAGAPFLRALAEGAAASPRVRDAGLDAGRIEQLLRAVLVERGGGGGDGIDEGTLAEILAAGAERAGVPVRPEEAGRIVRLLTTGEFFGDVASTTAVVLYTVPRLPLAVARDLATSPRHVRPIIRGLRRDLGGLVFDLPRLLADLRDGTLDDPGHILVHTMRALYDFSSPALIAETISTLIHPNNESVRLAIVIYARANGVPIEEADLDVLRTSVLNTAEPDLGPALAAAVVRLRERYGDDDLERVLAHLAG
jgi:hypothetical protein